MKGYAAASAPPAKRKWKRFSKAVPVVVFLSLVGTLTFVLGLHNRFPSGYFTDERSPLERSFGNYGHVNVGGEQNSSSEGDDSRITDLIQIFAPTLPKGVLKNIGRADGDLYMETNKSANVDAHSTSQTKDASSYPSSEDINLKGPPRPQVDLPRNPSAPNTKDGGRGGKKDNAKSYAGDETRKSCQLEFGSYCLWSIEHKEVMKDIVVKRLKDQLFVARAYYPSVAKLKGQENLSRELKQNIQDHERMLSEAISDPDLPSFVEKKIKRMEQTITRAKSCVLDCNNVDKKLRQILDMTTDEAHFHMKQSAFLYHLGVQTVPKSHHCLSMRLTVEYFKSLSVDVEHESHAYRFDDPSLLHYIIFSQHILAVSVAINSTVMNSEETVNMVFHVLTDGQNFYAMKLWFARNSYKQAVVHVLNVEDLNLNHSYDLGLPQLSPSEEFRVSIGNIDQSSLMRTKYISIFGHSHFLLPEIFKYLKKVVVLDDDVVVQRDLSSLWNIDLEGKVNGAVEFCGVRLGQLKNYLGTPSHDDNVCAWMSGLNIIDLEKWREHDVTRIYEQILRKFNNGSKASWRSAALPTSLLTFRDLIFPLDDSWVLSGLGHDYGVTADAIKNAAALHYNGNMKPWLDLGIPNYKKYWKKFLTKGEQFMNECNVV